MKIKNFLLHLLDYLYYRRCYICAKRCEGISVCEECLNKIYSDLSFKLADKYNTTIYSSAIYHGELLKIIRALKYHRKQEFHIILVNIIIKTIQHYNLNLDGFIICPVPIHQNRYNKRKYNHMGLVADELGKLLDLEVRHDLITRIKDTAPLYNLSALDRKKTVSGAFIASEDIKDKKILLIDDIITSGATICELSSLIRLNSPDRLLVIAASRSNSCNFLHD